MCTLALRALLPLRAQCFGQPLVTSQIQSIRTKRFDYRKECRKMEYPECSPKNIEKTKCMQDIKSGKRKPNPPLLFDSMWENPDCCVENCPMEPRLDEYFYKPSDKATRCYMQTWAECPKLEMIPQTLCCYEKFAFPDPEKRKRAEAQKTACSENDSELMDKMQAKNILCVTVTSPGCTRARKPPKCDKTRKRVPCKKVCCPFPSFSECSRDKSKRGKPVECKCLEMPNMCEAFAYMRFLDSIKKPGQK